MAGGDNAMGVGGSRALSECRATDGSGRGGVFLGKGSREMAFY